VLEKHNLLQTNVINQMTAIIATKTEVAHQVIIAKIKDDQVTDASKMIAEAEPQQIIHTDRIHQETTDTNHLDIDINHHDEMIDINHHDAMIATNHPEEIPGTNHQEEILDTNHPEEIQDINHLDAILTDHLTETIDLLNIAQIPAITVHDKVTIIQ
jgi:hypothetical protein